MRRFKSPGHAQRFLSVFGVIGSHFRPGRHRLSASEYRQVMAERFAVWRERTTPLSPPEAAAATTYPTQPNPRHARPANPSNNVTMPVYGFPNHDPGDSYPIPLGGIIPL